MGVGLERLLRLEWVALFFAGVVAYLAWGGSWLLALPILLAVDVSMIGYLAGPRVGAITYNAGHTLVAPFLVLGLSAVTGAAWLSLAAALWIAHIGMDRALGYGLKLSTGFQDTHLGRIGRR